MFIENSLAGKNQFWRWIISFIVTFSAWQMEGAIPLVVAAFIGNPGRLLSVGDVTNFEAYGIDPNIGLFLLLLTFLFGFVALMLSIRFIHFKPIRFVVTGRKLFSWKRAFMGAFAWFLILSAVYYYQAVAYPGRLEFQFNAAEFVPLLLLVILLIPIQTSFEEILFRGYFMQGLSLIFKNRWVPLLFTSLIFGGLHVMNPEVKEFGYLIAMPQYILFGLMFGVVTLMDEGLELAIGVHAINNIFASLFVTHSSSVLQTSAIYKLTEVDPVLELVLFCFSVFVFIAAMSLIYKWKDWSKLFRKVDFNAVREQYQ